MMRLCEKDFCIFVNGASLLKELLFSVHYGKGFHEISIEKYIEIYKMKQNFQKNFQINQCTFKGTDIDKLGLKI